MKEVYPMIVSTVKRACVNRTDQDAGSSSIEDFISSAVVRVLEAHPRYIPNWKLSTFLIPNIKGDFYGLMRREMTAVTTFIQHDPKLLPETPVYDEGIAEVDADSFESVVYPQLHDLIRSLPPVERAIIYAKYFENKSATTIAVEFWMKRKDVQEILARTLVYMQKELAPIMKGSYTKKNLHGEGRVTLVSTFL
jgi:RNA polymerase sigma factor (sigma-70 family)